MTEQTTQISLSHELHLSLSLSLSVSNQARLFHLNNKRSSMISWNLLLTSFVSCNGANRT
jgi:hypothetical protein